MKRIISLLAVMAIMAAMFAASAMPAFAAIDKCSCSIGSLASQTNQQKRGAGGQLIASIAHAGFIGEFASNSCGR